jgi:bifunctional DNA-binding transcriptional regulator/antitoxin component of YhaV-PrlF toxin-antitoxin module
MKTLAIVRDRGQLTIPDSIRKRVQWMAPMSPVYVYAVKPGEVTIRPQQTYINWDEIWAGVKDARSITGKSGATSASEFLQHDRASH